MYTFCRHIKTNGLRCESPAFLFPCSLVPLLPVSKIDKENLQSPKPNRFSLLEGNQNHSTAPVSQYASAIELKTKDSPISVDWQPRCRVTRTRQSCARFETSRAHSRIRSLAPAPGIAGPMRAIEWRRPCQIHPRQV